MSLLIRYIHTLRYLKLSQAVDRLIFRFYRPRLALHAAPELRPVSGRWECCARAPSMLGPARFRFLSLDGEITVPADWNHPKWPKLWLYNLHYFNDLNADDSDKRARWHRALIARWIRENPPVSGNGWEPYPISLRIVNWVKWSLAGNPLENEWLHSLAIQARWLRGRPEWHLLGNHLFANAKALVFAGAYFHGSEAQGWLEGGLDILERELSEQILSDGGHFERSPMYHSITCEDLIDLLNLAQCYPGTVPSETIDVWNEIVRRMLIWLQTMTHPDGDIVQFNDSAFGIAPTPAQLLDYATKFKINADCHLSSVTHLAETGYIRIEAGPAVAFIDVAPIGPDYLPGHAHADTFTFELSLFGQRWIVDSGCSTYESGATRLGQRGTAAHNTVVVDGADSSEVWGSFRVARRARVQELTVAEDNGACTVTASHDGYLRMPGRVIHKREITLSQFAMNVVDELNGRFKMAAAFILLHPDVEARQVAAGRVKLRRNGHAIMLSAENGCAEIEPAMWHPEFGTAHRTHRIRLSFQQSRLSTHLAW